MGYPDTQNHPSRVHGARTATLVRYSRHNDNGANNTKQYQN